MYLTFSDPQECDDTVARLNICRGEAQSDLGHDIFYSALWLASGKYVIGKYARIAVTYNNVLSVKLELMGYV